MFLLLPFALASRSILPASFVAGLRVFLEVVDELAMAIGVGGFAIGVEVYKSWHITVLLVCLGNTGRCRGSFTTSLLPRTSPLSSAMLSAISSSYKRHRDHVGGLLLFWRALPLGVVVPLRLGWNGYC